jgi:dihydrofolate reductase
VRKLILKMSVSVDGFVGGPNGELDWIFRSLDKDATAWTIENLWQAGVHIMGSRTFRDMAAYWLPRPRFSPRR